MKAGCFADLMEDMKSGVYDFTEDGKCSNCGQCCSDILPISEEDIKRIKAFMKKHGVKEQKHFVPISVPIAFDLTCPFRDNANKRCVIYPVRPEICRDFKCDHPKKQIELDKAKYHSLYLPHSMRLTFFGGKKDGKV